MMLEMYINNLLIDRAETDFRFASTVRERDENVKDLCNHLYKENMDKAFISHQKPAFFLVAESKANMIIQQDNDEALERSRPALQRRTGDERADGCSTVARSHPARPRTDAARP